MNPEKIPPEKRAENQQWLFLFGAWLIAALSTLGSLFFSEVMELVPCVLCWYQRIFLFPLAIILFVGLFPLDKNAVRYALPLAIIGLLFTVYHCLLFYGLIPETMQPCSQGVSCSDDSMILFGFLPIPLLSLAAFSSIIFLLLKVRKA
ncbi:Oxidoreductase, phage-associated [hydrothermal vent metagenome]|uniref:Oxidoreductase, phage-associated n=1 Tax=hydrothermal vent metagenome TaxID=652676 RepID=A0A3B0W2J6_9ZZZZ